MFGPMSQGYNIDDERIIRLGKLLMKEQIDNDDCHFIDLFIKQYGDPQVKQISKILIDIEDYRKLLKQSSYRKGNKDEVLIQNQSNKDILYVLKGCIEVKEQTLHKTQCIQLKEEEDTITTFHKNQCFFKDNPNKETYQVQCKEDNTKVMVINRLIYQQLMNDSEKISTHRKLKCIHNLSQELKKVEETEELMKMFDLKTLDKGEVISTPTAGVCRLSIVLQGQVGLFYPKKQDKNYIVFTVLEKDQVFNENQQLIHQNNVYGVLVLQDHTQLLILKQNYSTLIFNEKVIDQLRADSLARRNLYQTFKERTMDLASHQMLLYQQQLLHKFGLTTEVVNYLYEHEKMDKIVTSEQLNQKDQSMVKFDEFLARNKNKVAPQTKGGQLVLHTLSTNRIVSKKSEFNNLNIEQQRSMMYLQEVSQQRSGIRSAVSGVTTTFKDQDIKIKNINNLQKRKKNLMSMI